jgi:hypothetical protein
VVAGAWGEEPFSTNGIAPSKKHTGKIATLLSTAASRPEVKGNIGRDSTPNRKQPERII